MWNLLNLCKTKLYKLLSYLESVVGFALSFFTNFQKQQKNKKFSIYSFLSIKNDKNHTDDVNPFFPPVTSSTLQTFHPQEPLVNQCAVSEFNFDYSAPTPINWSDNNTKNTRNNTDKNNTTNFTSINNNNNNSNNTQNEYHNFDPDVLLSQFNASFNNQLAQTNIIVAPLDNHFVNTDYSLPLLELDHFKTTHTVPLSPPLLTDRSLFVNDINSDDDVPPLDDELFYSFFTDRPTKRERTLSTIKIYDEISGDTKIVDTKIVDTKIVDTKIVDNEIEQKITTSKIRKTNPINPSDAPYACKFCDVRFKVKGYLTRHIKKHNSSKPLRCPFFDSTKTLLKENDDNQLNDGEKYNNDKTNDHLNNIPNESISRCHITGGFSRRDTLNTHLKALHFIYPSGTKSVDRDKKSGHCGGCFKEFSNNKEWLTQHIMTNNCSNIITKYK